MLENISEHMHKIAPLIYTVRRTSAQKATNMLIHIYENMLLKGLQSLLEKSVKPHQQELPLSYMKRSHCQISSVSTQRLFEKRPTEFVRIATKRFLYTK